TRRSADRASTCRMVTSSLESKKSMILSIFAARNIRRTMMSVLMMNDFARILEIYVCRNVFMNLLIFTTHFRNKDIVQRRFIHLEPFDIYELDDFIDDLLC